MSNMSDYLEGKLRDHVLRGISFTMPTTLYIALCTSATDDTGGGTEVPNSGNYARIAYTCNSGNWTAANPTTNANDITSNTASANWGTVTHIKIMDSATYGAGNMLFHGALTVSQTINTGQAFRVPASSLGITWN